MIEDLQMGNNPTDIPKEIGDMFQTSYIFMVQTSIGASSVLEKSFTVKKIASNPALVPNFKAKYEDSVIKNIANTDEIVVIDEDENVIVDDGVTPICDSSAVEAGDGDLENNVDLLKDNVLFTHAKRTYAANDTN
ncbi:unnamed protein product [Trifolium pratense]|uniref:Uncharacterized protein n=1 Tax=Trifolium pratense TaxID=57577 RepID=A0ACB0J1E2_TRIPR|nr:unnamed protein product [Trifolium pratense]